MESFHFNKFTYKNLDLPVSPFPPLHYAAIESILGVEQIFRSNCLFFAHFWSKSDHSFFHWCKTVNIFQEKYVFRKYDKKYGIFWQKTWRAGLLNLKFFMRTKQIGPKKTSQNNIFDSPALHCENAIWNMKIFAFLNSLHQISEVLFR